MLNFVSLICYLIIFLFSAYLLNKKNQNNRVLYVIGLLIPIIFAAGRYKVGTDYWTYESIFIRAESYNLQEFVSHLIHGDEQLFLVVARYSYMLGGRVLTWGVLAALILIPVVHNCKYEFRDMSQGTAIAVFLFSSFASSFNTCREYVAVSFVLISLKYIYNNKPFKFLCLVLIAFLFHNSAIIALVLWFFWDHRNQRIISGIRIVVVVISTVVVVFLYRQAILFLGDKISLFAQYSDYYSAEIKSRNRDIFVYLLVTFVVLCLLKYVRRIDDKADFFALLLVVSVIIGFTGFTHPQFKRLALFFSVPAEIYFAGYIPNCLKKSQRILGGGLIICFYIFIFVLVFYILGQSHLFPYHFDLFSPVFN